MECTGVDCVLSVEQVATGWGTSVCRSWPWINNYILQHANAPCHTSLAVQHFLVKNLFQISPSHHFIRSIHMTCSSFWDSRWGSKVILRNPWREFNSRQQQVSQQTSRWLPEVLPSVAGPLVQVCMCKGQYLEGDHFSFWHILPTKKYVWILGTFWSCYIYYKRQYFMFCMVCHNK